MTGHYHNYNVRVIIILTPCRNGSNQTVASDAVTYENFSLQSPTGQQPVKPAKEDVSMEKNPSYTGVDCSNL